MKKITFLFIFILSINLAIGQSENKPYFSISTSAGLGVIEGHSGLTYDGEISKLFDQFSIGVYYNGMTSFREENPFLNDNTFTTFSAIFFELLSNFRTRSIQRSQNSIGLQFNYFLISSNKLLIGFGGGPNFNFYRSIDIAINSSEPFIPIATYIQIRKQGFSYHLQNSILYKINNQVAIGLKTRFMEFKDHNVSFMLSTSIQI